jgi:hypothetical protein
MAKSIDAFFDEKRDASSLLFFIEFIERFVENIADNEPAGFVPYYGMDLR